MFEDFINALRNFKSSKTRTLLSLLGIIIGVASVIMVTTVVQSATEYVKRFFDQAGLDLVEIEAGWPRRRSEEIELNENFRQELSASIRGIRNIIFNDRFSGSLRYGNLDRGITILAVEPDYFTMRGVALDYGRFFSVTEQALGSQKILLGSEGAHYLFPDGDSLGKTVILQMDGYIMGFEVAGVLAESETILDRYSFIPRSVYTRKISPGNTNAGGVLVQAMEQNDTLRIQADIKALVLEKTGYDWALWVSSNQSILDWYNKFLGTLSLLISVIAGISLLVGGIGIMNIMIVTVTERKKEIGIRKALGASPAAIRVQFLVESATITLAGGIVGIILGLPLSALAVSCIPPLFGVFEEWPLTIDWRYCLIAFAFCAVVGIFFGLHPALRAAKLDPVEALADV